MDKRLRLVGVIALGWLAFAQVSAHSQAASPHADPDDLSNQLRRAGVQCTPKHTRRVGVDSTLELRRYEVSCSGGGGYVLDVPTSDSGSVPKVADCLEAATLCELTHRTESIAVIAQKVHMSLDKCQISNAPLLVGSVPLRIPFSKLAVN